MIFDNVRKFDLVFNALHGGDVNENTKFFYENNIKYTGSNACFCFSNG